MSLACRIRREIAVLGETLAPTGDRWVPVAGHPVLSRLPLGEAVAFARDGALEFHCFSPRGAPRRACLICGADLYASRTVCIACSAGAA